jgi:hypothetical protein
MVISNHPNLTISETTTNEILFSVVQDICKEGLQKVIDANSPDLAILIRSLQILSNREITYSQLMLGLIYSKDGPHKNDKLALKYFKDAATPKGNAHGSIFLCYHKIRCCF